jgi:carbonic anhydrase
MLGNSKDALRNIVISQRLLGTREVAVFHHTGCGMLLFTTDQLKDIVKKDTPEASAEVDKFSTFHEFSNIEEAVKGDVAFLKESPLVLKETKITGWVHDVKTGKACRHLCCVEYSTD